MQRSRSVVADALPMATQRTPPQSSIEAYVRAALDAREAQGLPRQVEDRVALNRLREILALATAERHSMATSSVA